MTINKKILLVSSLSIISIAAIAGASAAILLKIKKDKNVEKSQSNEIEENKKDTNGSSNSNNKQDEKNDSPIYSKKPNEIYDDKTLEEINGDEVFPIVDQKEYYDQLNYKDCQGWIDDNMVEYMIKDIISRITVTDGMIKYSFNRIDNQNVDLYFIWFNKTKKAFRNYRISINTI